MFYVYIITNRLNGKQYVGKTNNFKARWKTHLNLSKKSRLHIHRAIRQDGVNNFIIGIVKKCKTEEEAFYYEKVYIQELRTFGNGGYNETKGGEGNSGSTPWKYKKGHTKETKQLLSILRTGKAAWNKGLKVPRTLKSRQKQSKTMSGSGNHRYGKPAWNRGLKLVNRKKSIA